MMSIAFQNLLTSPSSHYRIGNFSHYPQSRIDKHRSVSLSLKPFTASPLQAHVQITHFFNWDFLRTRQTHAVRAFESDATRENFPDKRFNVDAFLSFLEFLCLASSAVVSIAAAVNLWGFGQQSWFGLRFLAGQCAVLAGGMLIGAIIRSRQWRRICNVDLSRSGKGSAGINLVERIEKLEEDFRSSTKTIRVLSRQIEKLGTRFQVRMRNLKDPIAETAALAQKNSEATRALAMEGEILEKELGEIQKVLLAMQNQQEKQLELILAIGKTSKLCDNNTKGPCPDQYQNQDAPNTNNEETEPNANRMVCFG